MKIDQTPSHVLRGKPTTKETEFGMHKSQHAFEILSSGLYTDAVNAIVRELSSNAYDAHVANGNESEPFQIHLPSESEDWFSIRDFGTGLSPDDVTGLYANYFESTKTSSNDVIGGFGLGSKTPFAYSKNFQVTSYFQGVRYIFAVFVEDGFPKIAQLSEEPCTDRNGLEVRIPSTEHKRFREAVGHYTAYFKVRPIVLNCPHDLFVKGTMRESIVSHLNDPDGRWMFANRLSVYGQTDRVGAIYGQIPYPVNSNLIAQSDAGILDEALQMYQDISEDLVFLFDVGEVVVTANREELKYDDKTLAAFAHRINDLYAHFNNVVKTEVENFIRRDSLIEIWKHLANEVFPNTKYFGYVDYDGINCAEFTRLQPLLGGYHNDLVKRAINESNDEKDAVFKNFKMQLLRRGKSRHSDNEFITVSKKLTGDAIMGGNIGTRFQFIIADDPKLMMPKAKQWAFDHMDTVPHVVLLSPRNGLKSSSPDFVEQVEAIRNWLLNPELLYTSNLTYTKPVSNRVGTTRSGGARRITSGLTFRMNYGNSMEWSPQTENESPVFSEGGVYVYVPRGSRMYTGSKSKPEAIAFNGCSSRLVPQALVAIYNDTVEHARDKIDTTDIVGVPASDIKMYDKADNWVNIIDAVKEQATKDRLKYMQLSIECGNLIQIQRKAMHQSMVMDVENKVNIDVEPVQSILKNLMAMVRQADKPDQHRYFKSTMNDYPLISATWFGDMTRKLITVEDRIEALSIYRNSDFGRIVSEITGMSRVKEDDVAKPTTTGFKTVEAELVDQLKQFPMLMAIDSPNNKTNDVVLQYIEDILKNRMEAANN